jgi:poly(hydroxyalkanoate) depolymerase family esterase
MTQTLDKVRSMNPVDWRALYASNRAVIERAGGRPGDLPPLMAGAGGPAAIPPPAAMPGGRAAATPGRSLAVHAPAGVDPRVPVPLVVMLHGCTQDAASFAAATGVEAAADRHGFVVVHPEQDRGANPQGCWNWFEAGHQARGAGEPAAIAAIVSGLIAERARLTIDPARVFVAGLSAGGAMAAVLAAAYPDLFSAVAVHSGVAYRAAVGMGAAFSAMSRGAAEPGRLGADVHAARGAQARPMPAMVIHGGADRTVAPVNGDQVLAQLMAANRLAAPDLGELDPGRPTSSERGRVPGGHAFTRARWTDARGALWHERLAVEGMGHAWSGGTRGGSFTDPLGPDATEAIWRFFADATADARPPKPQLLAAHAD